MREPNTSKKSEVGATKGVAISPQGQGWPPRPPKSERGGKWCPERGCSGAVVHSVGIHPCGTPVPSPVCRFQIRGNVGWALPGNSIVQPTYNDPSLAFCTCWSVWRQFPRSDVSKILLQAISRFPALSRVLFNKVSAFSTPDDPTPGALNIVVVVGVEARLL